MRLPLLLLVALTVSIVTPDPAVAQVFPYQNQTISAGLPYYTWTKPGDVPIQVFVVGAKSGIYQVALGTSIEELVVLSDNASSLLTTSEERREVNVKLLRESGSERRVIYEAPLGEVLTRTGGQPELQEGDVLEVEVKVKRRFGWNQILSVASTATSIALLISYIVR